MVEIYSFGYWVLRRRKALDLTREELARQIGCATETIKKIERDERRPSRQITELLANALALPPEEHKLFLQVARGERSVDRLNFVSMPIVPLPSRLHNLPIQSTSFIGRQNEIADLKARLEDPQIRLLTIIGPGGIGKTRLALQTASELVDIYSGGAWLVALAPVSDPALVPREISTAVGVIEKPNCEISEVLVDFLKSRRHLLLVLDNCEHLLEACADLSALLIKNCPNLQILATSRQALGLAGEAIWPVSGLSLVKMSAATLSDGDHALGLDLLSERSEAIRLFVERAHLVQPRFRLTTRNMSAIGQICQSLDGMPLAIELAAARMNVLSVEEIASRLGERFQLLRSKNRNIEERHQTLHAVLDWSYNVLSEAECILFNRLSVFRASFTLEAAEAVGAGSIEGLAVLDLLSSLVEKSMVSVETEGSIGTRYRLLETLRLYGLERLTESGEVETIRRRHAAYFTRLAEVADPQLRGPQQVIWLERLELDHDNMRSALEWTSKIDIEMGLCLAAALWWFWIIRGYFKEGREWLERLLISEGEFKPGISNVTAYVRHVYLMSYLLDNQRLYQIAEEGLKRSRMTEDLDSMAISLTAMAGDPYYVNDVQKSFSLLEQSLVLFQQSGNKWWMANALRLLAALHEVRLFNHEDAKNLLSEAMTIFRELGDLRGISSGLFMLGDIERHLGHWDSANDYYQESLSYRRQLNDQFSMAFVLWKLGALALLQADYAQATNLRESSLQIFRRIHIPDMVVNILGGLAYLAYLRGESYKALELCHESLRIAEESQSRHATLNALMTLGEVALSQGDPTTALRYFRDSLVVVREHSLTHDTIVYALEALARLAISQDKFERAVRLLSAGERLRNTIKKFFLIPNVQANWESSLNQARAHLDEETFSRTWNEGHVIAEEGWQAVLAYAFQDDTDILSDASG